ncbi:MAG: amidohydrolase family protein, partial [Eggerthellaceae bacterium]|nr:amidohydrolase family protein [Eggerthellaceae bacterium]
MKTLFNNAVFHTMEGPEDTHHSMTVENGIIIAFDEEESRNCRVVDLQGRHAYPALIDAHLHLMETVALSSLGVVLCRLENNSVVPGDLAGIGEKIREHAAKQKPGSLMVFSNYVSAAILEHRLPTNEELDLWANGAPVWVLNIDGHSSSCSTALLTALGLAEIAPDGILVGLAHESNLGLISDYLSSSVTAGILARGIADFCNECASFGIGTVCALEGSDDGKTDRITKLMAFLAQGFPLDVRLFPQYMDEKKLAALLPRMGKKRVGGCMKWELDGSIGSRSAAFGRPYKDGTKGSLYFEQETIEQAVGNFANKDFFISVHAIGELAIEQLVGIFEKVPGTHRIDHCEFPSPEVLPRIYALKPYITVQPGYAWVDKRYLHGYARFLDDELLAQQVPLKDLMDHNVVLCGGSDSPVQKVDPYLQMRGMREF